MTTVLNREKLAHILGMLGSAHDGEVAAAGRKAHAMVRDAGLTWPEVIAAPALPAPVGLGPGSTTWAVRFCADHSDLLDAWERGFVTSLRTQRRPLSEKQRARLSEIVEKVRSASARAA
jgi:hypothetical protein